MNLESPACFGDLQTVFPLGDDGLRHTPETCFACSFKTKCLRHAMSEKDGLEVKEALVDRAYKAGLMGFWERWSKKKTLYSAKVNLKKK